MPADSKMKSGYTLDLCGKYTALCMQLSGNKLLEFILTELLNLSTYSDTTYSGMVVIQIFVWSRYDFHLIIIFLIN